MTTVSPPTDTVELDLRAKTLRALHGTIKHTRCPGSQELAIVMMAIRYGSATRMGAARRDLDGDLIERADARRFQALQRLVFGAVAR